tara:strand:+ start:262 stop:624 length:363 start_codon:yes stop_codon:yes gene_type:complete
MSKYQLCLVSTDGDMSYRGMGTKNSVYLFPYKFKKQVDDFLKAQLNFHIYTYDKIWLKKFFNVKTPYKKYHKTFLKLKDLKIFNCKYDFRTSWDMSIYDIDELDMYKPFKIQKNKYGGKF